MNFLGHIYFSDNDPELMYANLYGDFVKGSDLSAYPEKIRNGIFLHRAIDQYIDHQPDVLELMHLLYPVLPKVTGIAIDLYFDHLLALNWEQYHQKPFREYLDDFYQFSIDNEPSYPENYKGFIQMLKSHDWISHYPSRDGLSKMCQGVAQRISFPNQLAQAPQIFDQYNEQITNTFHLYMQKAKPYFEQIRSRF